MSAFDLDFKFKRIELGLKDVGLHGSIPSVGLCRPLKDPHEQWDESTRSFSKEHAHEHMMEILYVAKGRQAYQFCGKDYYLAGGDLAFAYPGEPHGIGEYPVEKSLTYWVQICMDPKARSFLGLSKTLTKPLLTRLAQAKHRGRVIKASKRLQHLFDEVFASYERTEADMKPLVMSLKLWNLIIEVAQCVEVEGAKNQSDDVASVLKYIDEHLEDGTQLGGEELADLAGLSRSRFQQKFRQEAGMTPSDYVNYRKIERAKELLAGGKYTVTHIAMRLGYDTSQGFARIFKRYTNKRPSDFLRRK